MFDPVSGTYLHSLNPFALRFWGEFGIRWYGLAYLAGFAAGYWVIRNRVTRGRSPLPLAAVGDFVFTVAVGTVIGGRLGYCLFYSPQLFTRFTDHFPFWGVLAINEGGMASHGGIIGIVVACLLYARRYKLPFPHLMDLTTLGGALGIFFGRIANFVNGELVGRPAPEGLRWAVKFPQDILLWPSQEPQRLADLAPVVSKVGVSPETWDGWIRAYIGNPSAYSALERTLHLVIAKIQQGSIEAANALAPLLTARHPSQLYEALLEGAFLFTALSLIWIRRRKPGVITGWFLSLYAIVRIIGEQFRMPDAQIGFQLFGLTRGQWLSIAMLAIALAVLIYFVRRPVPENERY